MHTACGASEHGLQLNLRRLQNAECLTKLGLRFCPWDAMKGTQRRFHLSLKRLQGTRTLSCFCTRDECGAVGLSKVIQRGQYQTVLNSSPWLPYTA